jgi:hypothetical protein
LAGYSTWGYLEFFGLCTGANSGFVEYTDREIHYNEITGKSSPLVLFTDVENYEYSPFIYNSYISEYVYPGLNVLTSGLNMRSGGSHESEIRRHIGQDIDSVNPTMKKRYKFKQLRAPGLLERYSSEELVQTPPVRQIDQPQTPAVNKAALRQELVEILQDDPNAIHDPEYASLFKQAVDQVYQPPILQQSSRHIAAFVNDFTQNTTSSKRQKSLTNNTTIKKPVVAKEKFNSYFSDEATVLQRQKEFDSNGCVTPSVIGYEDDD